MIPSAHVMLLAAALFCTGLVGLLVRRNLLFMLISVEIMLNAGGLAFIAATQRWNQADGAIMYLMILTMAAAELAVGLVIVQRVYRQFGTLDTNELRTLG
jgi:NADH-quinone oxidoreductase subunit K